MSYELRVTSDELGGQESALEWEGVIEAEEARVLALVARGMLPVEMSRETGYSRVRLQDILRSARQVLGTQTDTASVMVAIRAGVIALPQMEEIRMELKSREPRRGPAGRRRRTHGEATV